MCMCIEFAIQVSKQKNAHVSFPVEMVVVVGVSDILLTLGRSERLFFECSRDPWAGGPWKLHGIGGRVPKNGRYL